MIRHDPVAHDDLLVDELLSGSVPDDPIFAGLAAWRTSLAEMEAPPLPAALLAETSTPFLFASSCQPPRRVRPSKRGSRTGRAAVVVVGAALLLSMGIGQAVAGSPVAPLRYVVTRAVGIGDDVASPTASDVPRSQVPPSSAAGPSVDSGRSDAGTLRPTEATQKAESKGSSQVEGRGDAPDTSTAPDPAPNPGKGHGADDNEPTTKPPKAPQKPRPPQATPAPPKTPMKPPKTDAPKPSPTTPPTQGTKPPKGGYDWWDDDDKPGTGWGGRPHERPGAKDETGKDKDSDKGTGKDSDRGTGRGTGETPGDAEDDADKGASNGGGSRDSSYDWIWQLLNPAD